MQLSKMKNIIVLKGMASNVVEEAIVVLKPNVKIKQSEYHTKNKTNIENKNKKMIVIKEAESTINDYVKRLAKQTKVDEINYLKRKYRFLQVCNSLLILTIVVASIIIS